MARIRRRFPSLNLPFALNDSAAVSIASICVASKGKVGDPVLEATSQARTGLMRSTLTAGRSGRTLGRIRVAFARNWRSSL
jgi:hypothetical protein